MEEIKYWVWLSSLPGIGGRKSAQLLSYFEDPRGIWEAYEEDLQNVGFLSKINIETILSKKYRKEIDIHLENLYKYGIKAVTLEDKMYPQNLLNIFDPPVVLYVKGKILENQFSAGKSNSCNRVDTFDMINGRAAESGDSGYEKPSMCGIKSSNEGLCIAVVGSRHATTYGLSVSKDISTKLVGFGVTVISGMARGIDSSAHKGALEAGGATVAVIGCGLDIAYPVENKELMEEIINSGAVVSEYLPGIPPKSGNFPARNRIISGMSNGVLVVEAGERSGSLITADFALEQGREVFAIPGNITSKSSMGTNKLIKDGAKIVTCVEDILEEYGMVLDANSIKNISMVKNTNHVKNPQVNLQNKDNNMDMDEYFILNCLKSGSMHIDAIASACCMEIHNAGSKLFLMELNGLVEQLPGKIFRSKV